MLRTMMKALVPVVILLSGQTLMAEDQPLVIDAPPQWQVDYTNDKVHFYNLSRPDGENVYFIFSKWPTGGGRDQVAALVKNIADGYSVKASKGLLSLITDSEYTMEEISGAEFSGQAAVFKTRLGATQALFMVSDGDGLWSGQFMGSKPVWQEAKVVLGSLQRAE